MEKLKQRSEVTCPRPQTEPVAEMGIELLAPSRMLRPGLSGPFNKGITSLTKPTLHMQFSSYHHTTPCDLHACLTQLFLHTKRETGSSSPILPESTAESQSSAMEINWDTTSRHSAFNILRTAFKTHNRRTEVSDQGGIPVAVQVANSIHWKSYHGFPPPGLPGLVKRRAKKSGS